VIDSDPRSAAMGLAYSLSLPAGLQPGQAPASLIARTGTTRVSVPLINADPSTGTP
jgi:hypothetical protein